MSPQDTTDTAEKGVGAPDPRPVFFFDIDNCVCESRENILKSVVVLSSILLPLLITSYLLALLSKYVTLLECSHTCHLAYWAPRQ